MQDIKLGERIAEERKKKNLSQEAVAQHLGVTKAAVSKWECGQSLPDMSQMPKIASLFAITLDDLFGYEPQMTEEQINNLQEELASEFTNDPNAALEKGKDVSTRYWSCPGVLQTIGMLLASYAPSLDGGSERPMTDVAYACAEQAIRNFRRLRKLNPDSLKGKRLLNLEATCLTFLGKMDEAIALLKPLAEEEPSLAPVMLSEIYQEQGDEEGAKRVLQKFLVMSLVDCQTALAGMLSVYENDPDHLQSTLALIEIINASEIVRQVNPTLLPQARLIWAESLARIGDSEATLKALDEFARSFDGCCDFLRKVENSNLFDHVPEMVWDESALDEQACELSIKCLRDIYAMRLEGDEVLECVRKDERFKEILQRVKGECDG